MATLIKVCMKLKVLQKLSCILMQLPDSKNKLKEFDIRIVSSPKFLHISCFMHCIFLNLKFGYFITTKGFPGVDDRLKSLFWFQSLPEVRSFAWSFHAYWCYFRIERTNWERIRKQEVDLEIFSLNLNWNFSLNSFVEI